MGLAGTVLDSVQPSLPGGRTLSDNPGDVAKCSRWQLPAGLAHNLQPFAVGMPQDMLGYLPRNEGLPALGTHGLAAYGYATGISGRGQEPVGFLTLLP